MKNPFANLTVAVAGNFGKKVKSGDIQRWVEKAGGVYSAKVSKNTTHLVCSWEDYKAKSPKANFMGPAAAGTYPVKKACQHGIHVVSYDWLEDSLQARRARKERGKYLMANVEKEKRKEKKLIKRGIKKVDKKIRKGEKKADTHHIYVDETGFEYNIRLARVVDIATNKNDYFYLKIYETNTLPHLYASIARYRRPGAAGTEILSPIGSYFHEAFASFRRGFEARTGRFWEDRLDRVAQMGEREVVGGKYFYRPPAFQWA
ncbi:hypothetical protein FGG08_005882 [Glutinoglossum americanum]|uniref:BRCT domain-containing protein n=1 Tax=Glutinoglossum americanum TaxID=1670608 RepID=A0A9P8I2G2_9PEZI|nr:hypothetical protein FGG08_005882 [Glutinoglossum americanum]